MFNFTDNIIRNVWDTRQLHAVSFNDAQQMQAWTTWHMKQLKPFITDLKGITVTTRKNDLNVSAIELHELVQDCIYGIKAFCASPCSTGWSAIRQLKRLFFDCKRLFNLLERYNRAAKVVIKAYKNHDSAAFATPVKKVCTCTFAELDSISERLKVDRAVEDILWDEYKARIAKRQAKELITAVESINL